MARPQTVYDDDLINQILISNNEEKNKGFRDYLVYLKSFLDYNVGESYLYIWAYRIRTERLSKDYDHVTVITGKEGTGKSTLAAKLAVLVDPEMNIDRVCYKPEDFLNASRSSKPRQTIWIDEGGMFLFSRDSMSGINKEVIQFLTTCRQLNLHIIICIPNFFILDTYIREHRVHSLFHVMERGSFKYFREDAIFKIALYGKIGKNVLSPKILLNKSDWRWGSFNSYFPRSLGDFSHEGYLDHKARALMEQLDSFESKLKTGGEVVDDRAGYLTTPAFCKLTGLHPNTVRKNIHNGKLKARRIGTRWLVSREELDVVDSL